MTNDVFCYAPHQSSFHARSTMGSHDDEVDETIEPLLNHGINSAWQRAFHPEYEETAYHCKVTSHYGRHRFTTYWRVEEDLPRELVKYMRGDVAGNTFSEGRDGIDHYIHTYYEDIEDLYRNRIFQLLV